MRLHYILLMVVATLAASNAVVSAVSVKKLWKTDSIQSINTAQAETRSNRFLRTGDTNNAVYVYNPDKRDGQRPVFIEHKLQKALTNPKKTNKLYEQWYKSGYSAKRVAGGLNQDENRELDEVYKSLARGYAAYIKEKRS